MTRDNRAQVIVIGAGLSGLTAASELNRQGIEVIVLEHHPMWAVESIQPLPNSGHIWILEGNGLGTDIITSLLW